MYIITANPDIRTHPQFCFNDLYIKHTISEHVMEWHVMKTYHSSYYQWYNNPINIYSNNGM